MKRSTALVSAGLFLWSGALLAQPFEGHGSGLGKERLAVMLGLSEEQKDQLTCDTPGQGREIAAALQTERNKLTEMIRSKDTAEDAIRVQLDKLNQLQAQWNSHRLEKMLRARKVLTPAQLQMLLELQDEHPGARGKGPHGGRGRFEMGSDPHPLPPR
jgi:Spy/CpxP family protein refolding chaperone